mgnify:CR=1 FL=1
MPRNRRLSSVRLPVQLAIPEDVEMEAIPGCTSGPVVVVLTPTTHGAVVVAPSAVERYVAEVEGECVRVTLWIRRREAGPAS